MSLKSYKSDHVPSDEEITRLTLKHTHKLPEETVERIIATGAPVELEEPIKRKKVSEPVVEDEESSVKLHAVGTVKRVRRNAAEAMEELRLKKKMSAIVAGNAVKNSQHVGGDDIDQLFEVNQQPRNENDWEEEEEF